MKHQARLSFIAALALAVTLCGCVTYEPSIRHPTLTALAPDERAVDCGQIQVMIDRADTVRWVIRDDGGALESSSHRAGRYLGNVILVPLTVLLTRGTPLGVPGTGHDVLNAADGRIRELLQLKRIRGCPPRVTALPAMTDLDVLSRLESVQADIDVGRGEEDALLKERTRLLDGLRMMPAPAAASEATIHPRADKETRPASTD